MSAEKIGDIKEQLKSITDSQLAQFITSATESMRPHTRRPLTGICLTWDT